MDTQQPPNIDERLTHTPTKSKSMKSKHKERLRRNAVRILVWIHFVCVLSAGIQAQQPIQLNYVPGPPDNPLKGLVPYARPHRDRFPHSMEFTYIALSDILVGEEKFDWRPLETLLNDIADRGNQTVFRVWMEYPGKKKGIPAYLEQQGVKVTEWMNTNTAPFPPTQVRTPDYADPRVRKALTKFIAALGKRYDGDPRIGFITAGLLGTWGEWHTYPRNELMASKDVQAEVMTAYQRAFKSTPVLLRYPAGDNNFQYAANHDRDLGYHDDSFAWATLDTGRKEDSWFFVPAMKAAGAAEKWKRFPIGGEVRPELWAKIFDEKPNHKKAQDFATCVNETHVTWLMETGMFQNKQPAERVDRAAKLVRRMGYDLHIASVAFEDEDNRWSLSVSTQNRGVAPFYYNWKVQLGVFGPGGQLRQTVSTDWSIQGILPGESRT